MIVTVESLKTLLETKPDLRAHVIGRACVVLFNRQTNIEQANNTTDVNNGVGFAGMDAYTGSLTAKYYLKYKTLQNWQIEKWLKPNKNGIPRICKYHRQLNEAAEEKCRKTA